MVQQSNLKEILNTHISDLVKLTGHIDLLMDDNVRVTIPARILTLHTLLWRPYITYELPITSKHIYEIKAIDGSVFADIHTAQYGELLELLPDERHQDIINELWLCINDIDNFVVRYLGAYHQSMSAYSLSKIQMHDKIKALTDVHLDKNMGTKIAEKKMAELSGKLSALLASDELGDSNVLRAFMQTGTLNKNQIPQQMIAYSTRSDIDDKMMRHIINCSAMSGLRNIYDFATESLSAKKSSYFNKVVIKSTQYFARLLRLNNLPQVKMYRGSCGTTNTLTTKLNPLHTKQWVDKVVYVDGHRLEITKHNHKEFAEKTVHFRSPTLCRHKDGCCEECAGRRSSRPWAWVPQVHLGLLAATKLASAVSQMVLSAKHLISTKSLVLYLSDNAKAYYWIKGSNVYFKDELTKFISGGGYIKVAIDAIPRMEELNSKGLSEERFSSISNVTFVKDGIEDTIELANERFLPMFSRKFIKHMKRNRAHIVEENGFYVIPLTGFDIADPFMSYVVINDDMVAFTRAVEHMLKSKISEYTSISTALTDLSVILYSKTNINIFFVEVLLKSFLRAADGSPEYPVIEDPDNVTFGNTATNIELASISGKLGHEKIGNQYFANPATSVVEKHSCVYDKYFDY